MAAAVVAAAERLLSSEAADGGGVSVALEQHSGRLSPPSSPAPQPRGEAQALEQQQQQLPQSNTLVGLPIVAIEGILGFLSYDETSQLRLVCKRMDLVCQRMLNQGFLKVERYHNLCQKQVKAQLPRRESERRNHSLARHADILAAVETRLSLLNMTFMKYVDSNLCCFIPGKVSMLR
uniref:F-box protein 28 n=1 Tax=Anolis carolinensis TaxID=28377 RepID=G1KZD1_ANOCA